MATKRYMVTLPEKVDKMLDSIEMGMSKAEKIRNIVLSWLAEKSIISTQAKAELEKRRK